ncbi:hypothetical protein G6F57_003035 [Rhizopus arrhizus]|uniref:Nucleolar 27S pre-rRNA processing Urb2/Npa2 C-terminal domain-containing protein n=1 Tax=Rhizopus oryzae TaxID=64495 RepID=A0A9P7BVK2_RHIOR|nr:hypothetical protein G6F23_001540 [Rhizopus arrhizus]KAG1427374.1 hypothetical protein G6F58_001050 [Rhizopus delemar]KAG0767488.1 hypothetical protein G6F24_002748 [Rhizopus arrhizus]KAG0794065.1 hypothetical protein G6F21_003146 [Rhizopus arrhizus]KAG0814549.1 hypothetical protein G6F20_004682 [Rhizopus arrhizus]
MKSLNSETIAKALKGGSLSSRQKISEARAAWDNDSFFFPNKDEFLLSWICTCFAKPNMKKADDCCIFNIDYWMLLVELLQHYRLRFLQDRKRSTPFISVNLLGSISLLLQDIYSTSSQCLELLFSDSCSSSYRPAFEHVSAIVDQILIALEIQIGQAEESALDKLVCTAQLILRKFDTQLVLAANQKKVFFTLVEKTLCKLLSLRYQLNTINKDGKFSDIIQQTTQIICNGLFHPDIVLEYTSVLKDVSVDNDDSATMKQTSYVTKLFELLETMVSEKDQMLYAVDITPILLHAFLASFRQKRTSGGATQNMNRRVEFGMFVQLLKIIRPVEEHNKSAYLETLLRLLKKVLSTSLYSARNDDVSKEQFNMLNTISALITDYTKNKEYDQGNVLEILETLLQIDLYLVEPRLQLLWPIMLNPLDQAEKSCILFATSVLNAFTASRQMDTFVEDLIRHINKMETDNLFSASVSKHMPAPQALGIFEQFSHSLTSVNHEMKEDKQVIKKRKIMPDRNRFALISVYFCNFITSLKLNPRQRQTLEDPSLALFDKFIKPSICNWNVKTIHNTFIPAIQVHSALTYVLCEHYTQKISNENLVWFEDLLATIFKTVKQHDSSSTRTATVLCVYFVEESDHAPWYMHTVWDGSISSIENKNQMKIACWKLITDEWFETIVQCLEEQRAKKFITIIYDTMKYEDESIDQYITASKLTKSLLRRANFYEAKCSKEWSIQTFLSNIVHLFKTKLHAEYSDPILSSAVQMVSNLNTKEAFVLDKIAIKNLLENIQSKSIVIQEDIEQDMMSGVQELDVLLKILLIFPSEYFEKNERTLVVYIATLVDIWCVSNTQLDPLIRSKISLTCKSLALQFIHFFSIHSVLGFDSKILAWLITSSRQLSSSSSYVCKSTSTILGKLSDKLEESILRRVIAFAGAKSPEKHAVQYLTDTAQRCITNTNQYITNGLPTETVSLLNAMVSFLNTRKISSDIDLSNVIYVYDTITTVSNDVVKALDNVKTVIISAVEGIKQSTQNEQGNFMSQYTSNFESATRALYLARLLHEYLKPLRNSNDKVLSTKELSRSLMGLASPVIQLLQSALDSNGSNTVICHMATEFIAAFCSMPSSHQHLKASKHILATFWFIYSLIYNAGDMASVELLSNAFVYWIKGSSREQFDLIVEGFIEQAEEQVANRSYAEKKQKQVIFVRLLFLLFGASSDYQKTRLKKQLPVFIIKVTLIAEKVISLEFMQMMLKLLAQLTVDESYRLSSFDVSLILSCLVQIARPEASKILKNQINKQSAHDIFSDICNILSNLTGHYKEQLIDVLPPYIAITQALLHCFKSGHVLLVNGLDANPKKRKNDTDDKKSLAVPRTIALLSNFAPLNDTAAQNYARLLKTILQKQHSYMTMKTNRSNQSLIKAIAKHTPSLLIEYFTIQSNATMSILQPSTKSILTNALYDILEICSDNDRAFIMACLDASGKLLFKEFYSNWKENHKYSGQ